MRMLILGQSDSAGVRLPEGDRGRAWPVLVARELEPVLGEPVELLNRQIHPLSWRQVEQVDSLLDTFAPDIVCLGVSPHAFMTTTVKGNLRRRWGNRAFAWAVRVEAAFNRLTSDEGFGRAVRSSGRELAAKLLGTAPISPYAEVVIAYQSVLARIALREGTQVIVMGGNRFATFVRDPEVAGRIVQFEREMIAAAQQRRFLWFNTESSFAGVERKSHLLDDRLHRNVAGHQRFAELLTPVLVAALDEGSAKLR